MPRGCTNVVDGARVLGLHAKRSVWFWGCISLWRCAFVICLLSVHGGQIDVDEVRE